MHRVFAFVLLAAGLSFGCRARVEPPMCTANAGCSAGEACIDGSCQACRDDADCDGQRCIAFRCSAEPDACNVDEQCEPGLRCVESRCRECSDASECQTGVCHPSGRCEPPPCASDEACPEGELCDGGQCITSVGTSDAPGVCGIGTIYFARDSAKLSPTNQLRLADASACLLEHAVVLAAARGGDEALAQRRGETIRAFLISRGVPESRVSVTISDAHADEAVRLTTSD